VCVCVYVEENLCPSAGLLLVVNLEHPKSSLWVCHSSKDDWNQHKVFRELFDKRQQL